MPRPALGTHTNSCTPYPAQPHTSLRHALQVHPVSLPAPSPPYPSQPHTSRRHALQLQMPRQAAQRIITST